MNTTIQQRMNNEQDFISIDIDNELQNESFTSTCTEQESIQHIHATGTKRTMTDTNTDNIHTSKRPRVYPTIESKNILSLLKSNVPWIKRHSFIPSTYNITLTPGISPIRQLHEEIISFDKFISPTEQERKARNIVVDKVTKIMHELWPNATVRPFGSLYTGLYLPHSDIDLVVTCPEQGSPLRVVARALTLSNLVQPGSMKIITKARIPLVKFVENNTQYIVDISFNQDSGVEGSYHIKELLAKYPALRPLLLVIKQFLKQRHLNEVFTGGLGSYALTLLIVNFLQLHPMIQYGWIKQEENLGVLLIEFFELYGKAFSYERVGISILGRGRYFDKSSREWFISKPHLLSIEDPYNPENDVTKGSFSIQTVRQAFYHAYILLSSILIKLNHQYDERYSRNFHFSSILSSIIDMPDKSLYHREYIGQLMSITK